MGRLITSMLAAGMALGIGGCSESATGVSAAGESDPPAATNSVKSLPDRTLCDAPDRAAAIYSPAETASILLVLIQGDVLLAQTASAHGTSSEVKWFAHRTVAESMEAMARLLPVARALGASQLDRTAALVARHDRLVIDDLRASSGPSFDLAFATAEVAASARTAALLDRVSVPAESDVHLDDLTRLQSAIERTARAAEARLDHALALQRRSRALLGPADIEHAARHHP